MDEISLTYSSDCIYTSERNDMYDLIFIKVIQNQSKDELNAPYLRG